jgi:multicomponent Na+:H+ antiporter subunit E
LIIGAARLGTGLAIVLLGFWLLLSGHYTAFLVGGGIGSTIVVVWFAFRLGVVDEEGFPIHLGWSAVTYWPWLLKEIVKSAWDVAKIIVHPALPISPALVTVTATQKTVVGRVTYANSITLTPGTITVELEDDRLLVHAITRGGAESLVEGEMDRRVTAFEQGC